MKNSKILLSVFMVLVIICVSVAPTFATVVEHKNQQIIDDELATIVNESKKDDKIPVVIWYKDVSQTKIDTQVRKNTGLTVDTLSEELSMPDDALLNEIKQNNVSSEKKMQAYLENTKVVRDKERANTQKFIQERRKLSRQEYNEKSVQIIDVADISDSDIIFNSQYAPMIICEVSTSQIKELEKDARIESISYYEEPVDQACVETNIENVKPITRQNDIEDLLGLTGDGVKVGMIEGGVPGDDEELPEGSLIIVGDPDEDGHATGTAKVLKGIVNGFAKNIELYSTDGQYSNIELLLTQGVDVINVSWDFHVIHESYNGPLYAYSYVDRWYDHIISYHNVTIVASAGNAGDGLTSKNNPNEIQRRIATPAMGNNVIAVGAYKVYSNGIFLNSSSSYKNSNGTAITQGVEKPDVVMPANSYIDNGGTSYAAPILTAMIAQVLELKPSLSAYPQAIKAIVLASCHRKAVFSTEDEEQETMEQGITERQGAGAPDAWTMASIISQGSYGVGVLDDTSKSINFVQPPYGAENMNVSITWIKENTHSNTTIPDCDNTSDIVEAPSHNLDLQILHNNQVLCSSSLSYSSTEMCYFPLSVTDYKYQIRLINNSNTTNSVRYGYAWSTDDMRAAPVSNHGVYYIKNVDNNKYITYTEVSNAPQVVLSDMNTQTINNDAYQWVIKGVNLIPGCTTEKLYLAQSSTAIGRSWFAELNADEQEWFILYNDDGTVSLVNSSCNRILSYNGDNIVWDRFSMSSSVTASQKWYLEKNNYIVADANADGVLSPKNSTVNLDAQFIQHCLAGMKTATNLQTYLSDANRNGTMDILDANLIQEICNGNRFY